MEHIRLSPPEKEVVNNDDPRKVIIEQEARKRNEALDRMREEEAKASISQNIIEMIELEIHVPMVILEVDFLDYEYDIYTYSSSVKNTQQFSIRTDSLAEAIQTTARFINPDNPDSKAPTSSLYPELKSIGVAIGATSYQEVEKIHELKQLFASTVADGKK